MNSIKVTEIMVPIEEFTTISGSSTLMEAVITLEKAKEKFDHNDYRYKTIIVLDKNNQFVGKLNQHYVLMALEPKYNDIAKREKDAMSRFGGMSDMFMKYTMDEYSLWQKPLDNLCKKAMELNVRDIMYTPSESESVKENATMNEAIHKLVIGKHNSLLVTREQAAVGVLRLTDVFERVFKAMQECRI